MYSSFLSCLAALQAQNHKSSLTGLWPFQVYWLEKEQQNNGLEKKKSIHEIVVYKSEFAKDLNCKIHGLGSILISSAPTPHPWCSRQVCDPSIELASNDNVSYALKITSWFSGAQLLQTCPAANSHGWSLQLPKWKYHRAAPWCIFLKTQQNAGGELLLRYRYTSSLNWCGIWAYVWFKIKNFCPDPWEGVTLTPPFCSCFSADFAQKQPVWPAMLHPFPEPVLFLTEGLVRMDADCILVIGADCMSLCSGTHFRLVLILL